MKRKQQKRNPEERAVADVRTAAGKDRRTIAADLALSSATAGTVRGDRAIRPVFISRALSNAAQDGITYGAVVATVSAGGRPIESALIGAASVIPPATIGVYGGAIADALPKKAALALGYLLQAVVCLLIPYYLGTGAMAMAVLILLVNVAGQISGPAESAVVPLVVAEENLGKAASAVSFAGAAGSAAGTAVLAPVLVTLFGVRPLFYAAALCLAVCVVQTLRLPRERRSAQAEQLEGAAGIRASLHWLVDNQPVTTMLLVAAIAGTFTKILQTLAPGYVDSAFNLDPAKSVYVFAPTSLGMLLALVSVPLLLRLLGERTVAVIGVLLAAVAIIMLGVISRSAELMAGWNPVLEIERLDDALTAEILTAATLAIPVGFGVNAATMAVTVYVQKRVEPSYQGRAFALNSVLKNLVTVGPLLLAGAVASGVGEQWVLFALPWLLVVMTSLLISWSYRLTGRVRPRRRDVIAGFLREPEEGNEE